MKLSRTKSALTGLLAAGALAASATAADTNSPLDLGRGLTLYKVAYSHLDTQWRWTYPQVIGDFLRDTVRTNAALIEKYPHYVFNWTGANRYRFMQEYHPEDFALVRDLIARGRWFPNGSAWEENDLLVPSSESQIRQILFGHDFFKTQFGVESCEYMLPDCFGFPASLPSLLAHCGLRGFSTQKLTWRSANGIPFNIGNWIGPDGNSVIAALNCGNFDSTVTNDLSCDTNWIQRLQANGKVSGVFADFSFYGVGDRGGGPDDASTAWVEKSVSSTGPVRVVSARADQLFNDISDAQKSRLPNYWGDLLLIEHSAGSLTSQAYMKKWNRDNELLADAAERASVAAWLVGGAVYPREKLHRAWELVLGAQFHDILPGTSLPKAYEYSWNDEIIALNCFAEALRDAVGAVARKLDTRGGGTPLVVFNPLAHARQDVVEAELELPGAAAVQVFDGRGQPVPTQMISTGEDKKHFLFAAKVPPVGFAVFFARGRDAFHRVRKLSGEERGAVERVLTNSTAQIPNRGTLPGELKISARALENSRYRVTLNDDGDLASVFDKAVGHELLAAPARLAFQTEKPRLYPAWNMDWKHRANAPRGYVGGPAKFKIIEAGQVRVALQVERETENSVFIQTYRLAAGSARVEVINHIDWQSTGCSLKGEFPLTVANPLATYNWELGKVQRGNNFSNQFEVPSHGWIDLTDASGKSGVSILTGAKYGSDKPADNVLRLTLLYTPATRPNYYHEQQWQDWGRHDFSYALFSHRGGWRDGDIEAQSEAFQQPLLAFQTGAHKGKLGRSFSLLNVSSGNVAVRAVKLAENDESVIVRLQELAGEKQKSVKLGVAAKVDAASEADGVERVLHPQTSERNGLTLDFSPYQIRTLALQIKPLDKLDEPIGHSVVLPYNSDVFSGHREKSGGDFDGQGASIPAEMIRDEVISEGVRFTIGPRGVAEKNAVACRGQTMALPTGKFNRLYLLAAANGDAEGIFLVDGNATKLRVQNWTGTIGQWDNRVFLGEVEALTYNVTNELARLDAGFIKRDPIAWFCSHRHLADGTDAIYSYSYLFKYALQISPGAKFLTLPDNPRIHIIAATVAQNKNDETLPVHPLYDDFSDRTPLALKPVALKK